jgi:hypothetical protein
MGPVNRIALWVPDQYDRTNWGPGPWDDEPDIVQWLDPATRLPCYAARGSVGSWCGYVAIPEGHPDYGVEYDQLDQHYEVHGGLTWSSDDMPHAAEAEGNWWWIGFDCIHWQDIAPVLEATHRELFQRSGNPLWDDSRLDSLRPTYKTLGYVEAEVTQLAQQVAERRTIQDRQETT